MELVLTGLWLIAGLGIGWLLSLPVRKVDRIRLNILQQHFDSLLKKEQELREEHIALLRESERLKENLRLTEEKLQSQKKEMGELQQLLSDQFRNLATEILDDKSRRFTETNRENIEKILSPLNKDIEEFRKKVDEAYHKESTERTILERKIAELVQLNNQLRVDAANLTNALKGNTKTQGDWGEMILERILENSGLTRGREYFVQETLKDDANRTIHGERGNLMRPDVVIVYPDSRKVIIDSKVSLTAYVNYCNAETDVERELTLKAHMQSIRKHIDIIRRYMVFAHELQDDITYMVIARLANEASYVLAMQTDSALWNEAYRKRVLLLSPANLIVSLKLTADLWSREYQNRNALEIAERGAKLYDKCVSFLESFTSVGESIRKTQDVYEQAFSRLKSGNGNLIAQTMKLKELGVKSRKGSKEIPQELADGAEPES